MKKQGFTRPAAGLLAAALALGLGLAGCGSAGAPSAAVSPSPAASASAAADAWRTGLGLYTSCTASDGEGKATITAAAVLLDPEGRIRRCTIDAAENEVAAGADGAPANPPAAGTKWEQGENYGMRAASDIDREWYEQAQAFCAYVEGKTAQEVAAIETEDGRAVDPDLTAGCTMRIAPLMAAAARACENAKNCGAAEGDTLRLGTVSRISGTAATDDANGVLEAAATFAALTLDSEGRVTGAVLDEAEPVFTVDTVGTVLAPKEAVRSKLEQGEAYGMREASSIGKEWYEQSEGFCAFLKGKTASEIAGIPADGSEADLAAVCTVSPEDFLAAAVKAAGSEA